MATISAYKPTSYAPSNVTNGTTGATTPEAQRNQALQSVSSFGSNPYAEAIQHTMGWIQRQMPPAPTTPVVPQTQPQTATAPLGTSPLAPSPTPTASPYPFGKGEVGGGMQNPDVPDPTQPPTPPPAPPPAPPPGGTPTPPPPGGTPPPGGATPPPAGQAPFDPAKYAGINDYATKFPAGETWAQYQTRTGLNGRAWAEDDYQRAALEYGNTPGYEWLSYGKNYDIIKAYHAEVTGGGEAKGKHIAEWVIKNWDGIAQKLGVQPADVNKMYQAMAPAAYGKMAERLRNEYTTGGGDPNKVAWVNGAHAQKYSEWYKQRFKNGQPTLSFWEWAGSINVGKPPAGWIPDKPPGAIPPPGGAPPPGGPPPPGGAGVPPPITPPNIPAPPAGPMAPDRKYMDDLIKSLREQGKVGREAALRQFKHEAGATGQNQMGSYNPAVADLISGGIGKENQAIYEIMNSASESEANRTMQQYLGQLGYSGQIGSANIGANASNYGDQIRYLLGMTGYDVDREQNWWENQINYQEMIIKMLSLLYGVSPDQILGGWQPPTGDAVVT